MPFQQFPCFSPVLWDHGTPQTCYHSIGSWLFGSWGQSLCVERQVKCAFCVSEMNSFCSMMLSNLHQVSKGKANKIPCMSGAADVAES